MRPIALHEALFRYPAPGHVSIGVFAPATPNRWRVETLHQHPLVLEVTASSSGEARMRAAARLGIAACLLDAERV